MVKVEKDPFHKDMAFANYHIKNIQSLLPDNHFLHWTRVEGRDFEGRIEIRKTTIEKRFLSKRNVTNIKDLAGIEFRASSMELFLVGKEDELIEIAHKLEENGYNVTIWI